MPDFIEDLKDRLLGNKIIKILIIAVIVLVLGLIIFSVVRSAVSHYYMTKVIYKTPIVKITAKCDKTYAAGSKVDKKDIVVTAIHKDGKKNILNSDSYKITDKLPGTSKEIRNYGKTSSVTVNYTEAGSKKTLSCVCDIKVKRKKLIEWSIGYPDTDDVKATIYSNGELCFSGEGNIATFNTDEIPWRAYGSESSSYSSNSVNAVVRSVTFDDTVQPTVIDDWFSGMETLEHIDKIPGSVQSMNRTFSGCSSLTETADTSSCKNLLQMDECYASCTSLLKGGKIVPSVKRATYMFNGCTRLQEPADVTQAASIETSQGMYSGCKALVYGTIPPKTRNTTEMFLGCINLKECPDLPNGVKQIDSMYSGCTSLERVMSKIPKSVISMSELYQNCTYISGEMKVNCNTDSFDNMFSGACLTTQVNLVGKSYMLDAYANTNDNANVFVNRYSPDPEINDMSSAIEKKYQEIHIQKSKKKKKKHKK